MVPNHSLQLPDNPYQRPGEALPDDEEASSLLENPARERGRFGGS